MGITRRKLVRRVASLGAGLALAQIPILGLVRSAKASDAESGGGTKSHPAVLYDLTKCVGCHLCEVACQMNKGLPPETSLISFRTADPDAGPKGAWAVRRHQCMHCLDPGCVLACPVGAMHKTPEGPVIYRDERCLGCRYCMNACPFGVPTFDWDSGLLDQALIRKCDFCFDRQAEGKLPACIEACPTGAVIFGDRSELLTKARAMIAAQPNRYVDHIYGEHEAGGTSFLLISGVPFKELGLPDPGTHPLPPLPEKVMGLTIPVALTWGAILSGVAWIANRRTEAQSEKGEEK